MAFSTDDFFKKALEQSIAGNTQRNKQRRIPSDEWGHKDSLITNDEIKDVNGLWQLLSKELALANIEDDFMITLLNERWGLTIIPLFQLWEESGPEGDRDAGTYQLMMWFLTRSLAGLKLTRSKGMIERGLQAEHPKLNEEKKGIIPGLKLPGRRQPEENEGVELYE